VSLILDSIRRLIIGQVDVHGVVIWFDPQRDYAGLVGDLALPHTTVVRYKDSFFALRHEIESLLDGLEPPRLLIYVPLDPARAYDALAEVQAAGVTMQPGQQPPERNTNLALVARQAVLSTGSWTEADAARLARDIEAGKYNSLAEIEQVAQRHARATGALELIYGSGEPAEVALIFLSDPQRDTALEAKKALPELAPLLAQAFGAELSAESAVACRARLARHILVTDMLSQVKDAPASLATLSHATSPAAVQACVNLASAWRSHSGLRESYVQRAAEVAQGLGLFTVPWTVEQIGAAETFVELEQALQLAVAHALVADGPADPGYLGKLVALATARQSSFWAESVPTIQAEWALIGVAGQVLRQACRIEDERKDATQVEAMFRRYTEGEHPWCLLDTYHRQMERRYHHLDPQFDLQESLDRLVTRARQRYTEVGARLSQAFTHAYAESHFRIPGVLLQRETYEKWVKPRLGDGKTAYVLVDALRYEMAHELCGVLAADYQAELVPAVAMVPTITEIGMAALLPGAHASAAVVALGSGKLALEIGGTKIGSRKERLAFLTEHAGVPVCEAKLEDLLPHPKRALQENLRQAALIVVTSQDIDLMGEEGNIPLARQVMGGVLDNLRRALRVLTDLGVQAVVVTSDHGYLFGEELGSDMKIEPPGGNTADLHRRVWVGQGGVADPAFLRATLADFGVGGGLEIATPWNWACFTVQGGARAYFHGGLSPQELIVPVLTIKPQVGHTPSVSSDIAWELIPGSNKITAPFFSVQVKGRAKGLFGIVPPKVRLEIRVQQRPISLPISASYGFEDATRNVQLALSQAAPGEIEPNTITLQITDQSPRKVHVHLLDATSGAELGRLADIDLAISF
jgi:hypothetical protein